MTILKTSIDYLNNKINEANIFDRIYGLCELIKSPNDNFWGYYIGNGQYESINNFDANNATLFWSKRSTVNITKFDSLSTTGCIQMYKTIFPLNLYVIANKSALICDNETSADWLANAIFKLISGKDSIFKKEISVSLFEVIPMSYSTEVKNIISNYNYATLEMKIDIEIVSSSKESCYDFCI
jgi:hypothetical protein